MKSLVASRVRNIPYESYTVLKAVASVTETAERRLGMLTGCLSDKELARENPKVCTRAKVKSLKSTFCGKSSLEALKCTFFGLAQSEGVSSGHSSPIAPSDGGE